MVRERTERLFAPVGEGEVVGFFLKKIEHSIAWHSMLICTNNLSRSSLVSEKKMVRDASMHLMHQQKNGVVDASIFRFPAASAF